MNYTKGLIDRTRELLEFKTQAEMADYFGVTRKQVSEWRNGNATPPYSKLIKIATDHNIDLNWFFFGIGKKYMTSENIAELHKDIKENNKPLVLSSNLSSYEKQVINTIVEYMPFVPRAFFDKVIDSIAKYKEHFKDVNLDKGNN